MKIFIWERVEGLTTSWHDGGGVAVMAESLEQAEKPGVIAVFPDPGCC